MTRVNLVDPSILTRQHLLAEHREITRIPNQILAGKLGVEYVPNYRMGKGHVKFFTTRLKWLKERYTAVHNECIRRGYGVTWKWPDMEVQGDYAPTKEDIDTNLSRLIERDSSYLEVVWT